MYKNVPNHQPGIDSNWTSKIQKINESITIDQQPTSLPPRNSPVDNHLSRRSQHGSHRGKEREHVHLRDVEAWRIDRNLEEIPNWIKKKTDSEIPQNKDKVCWRSEKLGMVSVIMMVVFSGDWWRQWCWCCGWALLSPSKPNSFNALCRFLGNHRPIGKSSVETPGIFDTPNPTGLLFFWEESPAFWGDDDSISRFLQNATVGCPGSVPSILGFRTGTKCEGWRSIMRWSSRTSERTSKCGWLAWKWATSG